MRRRSWEMVMGLPLMGSDLHGWNRQRRTRGRMDRIGYVGGMVWCGNFGETRLYPLISYHLSRALGGSWW